MLKRKTQTTLDRESQKRRVEDVSPKIDTQKCQAGFIQGKIKDIPTVTPPIRDPKDRKAILKDLHDEGVCVVRVLSEEQAETYRQKMWAWFEDLGTGIDRKDPKSWDRVSSWLPTKHGIVKSAGAGQAPFMWELRLEEGVLNAFASIHGVQPKDLLASFDGFGLYPPKQDASAFALPQDKKVRMWPHKDQDLRLSNPYKCVQGVVYLSDNRKRPGKDGGFMYWPKTHTKGLEYWMERFSPEEIFAMDAKKLESLVLDEEKLTPSKVKNWWKVPGPVPGVVDVSSTRIVIAPPGCMVLWPSTTVHANAPPLSCSEEEKEQAGQELQQMAERAVAYICMHKRSLASTAILKRRIKYSQIGATTSHWPHMFLSKNADPKEEFRGPYKWITKEDGSREKVSNTINQKVLTERSVPQTQAFVATLSNEKQKMRRRLIGF